VAPCAVRPAPGRDSRPPVGRHRLHCTHPRHQPHAGRPGR
jgi:hypothetical protein